MPATEMYRGQLFISTPWASGAATASAIQAPGYAVYGLILPPITSGAIAPLVCASAESVAAGMSPVYDKAGAIITAATPGGTGGAAIDSNALAAIAGYPIFTVSGAPQTANRTIIWTLKG